MTPGRDALIVVDLQRGFDDPAMGRRNNPECGANVARLVAKWRDAGDPVVFVRHDSLEPQSPLRPRQPGNELMREIAQESPDLTVAKSVHSAFSGDPDLHGWLTERGVKAVTICGITTDHCCSTTARVACDLGYEVRFVVDATSTFPRTTPSGRVMEADEVSDAAAGSLDGEFAAVISTAGACGRCDQVVTTPRSCGGN